MNGGSWSVTLHPLVQAGFHHAWDDQKWEWLGRHGPIPCVVWGAHTGHIETNTLHHIEASSIKLLGGRWRRKHYHTVYSMGERVGTQNTHCAES